MPAECVVHFAVSELRQYLKKCLVGDKKKIYSVSVFVLGRPEYIG